MTDTTQRPANGAGAQQTLSGLRVWIDQDICTGDGLCEQIAPAVFTLLDDGFAYVKEGDNVLDDPGGSESMAAIPQGELERTIEASEECPGECIFIETGSGTMELTL